MKLDQVLNIDTSEKFEITVDKKPQTMTLYEMSRWYALIRGIQFIDRKADQLKIDLASDKSWVKPLALQKFIDEDTPSCVAEIKVLINKDQEKSIK